MSHGDAHAQVPVRVGDILAGKYRIVRVLGAGGMGVVVAAHHLQLDEPVALKFLLPAAAENPSIRGRFLREGQAAVKIRSEHVARILDVGTLETGAPYLVMELLEGVDLADKLKRTGPLPVDIAVDYLLQACHAIGVAHSLGIVHRDIKPANLFLTTRPDGSECVKVLDFGISKLQGADSQFDMTSTGAVLGSPFYMSPEQFMSSKHVDARADVWSLGAVFYKLLTDRVPFDGDSIGTLVAQVFQAPVPPLGRADVSPALEAVVHRALAKNAAERFASVAELASALAPFVSERSRTALDRVLGLARARNPDLLAMPNTPERVSSPPFLAAQSPMQGTTPLPQVTPMSVPVPGSTPMSLPAAPGSWGSNTPNPTQALLPASATPPFAQGHGATPSGSTTGALSASAASPSKPSPVVWLFAVVAVAALGIAGVVLATRGSTTASRPTSSPSQAAVPSAVPPTIPEPATTETAAGSVAASEKAPEVPPSSEAVSTPSASSAAQKPPSRATAPAAPTSAPKAPTKPSKPAPNCDPPFTVDANGDKHAKPDCL